VNFYSLLVYIEHNGDESPKDVLIKAADPVCIQMATAVGMPLRYKEEKLEYGGHAVAQLVEALRYKPEGRGLDSRWCHWIFSLT
jgi:hypothetical protein